MIRPLNSKDLKGFIYFCQNRDKFSDFYITKNNKRLFLTNIKTAKQVFNDCLKHGEQCLIKEENGLIQAIMIITGFKDKFPRKYIKVLSLSKEGTRDLFRCLVWQKVKNLFIKTRKSNTNFVKYDEKLKKYKPSFYARKAGFRIIVERNNEILLKKEEYNREPNKYNRKRN